MKRRIARWRYFNADQELENVRWFHTGANGKPDNWATPDGPNLQFGTAIGASRQTDWSVSHKLDHRSHWLAVERTVKYLDKPDRHQCDWRCMGAKPGGECWCECGGRNHGRNYRCELAA